jgi:hypothetical protein
MGTGYWTLGESARIILTHSQWDQLPFVLFSPAYVAMKLFAVHTYFILSDPKQCAWQ